MLFFILFWLLLFGGAIGSFLNVVIYRLPAGLSLSYPPSRCPICEHPIRPRDNVPVFGWILLHGKCRDCHAPISVRYPLMEGLCVLLFVTVGYAVLVNRPFGELEQSLGLIVCSLLLLTTLLAAGMIDYDGKKVSIHLFVPAFFGALLSLAISWNDTLLDFPPLLASTPLILFLLHQNRVPWLIAVTIAGLFLGWQPLLIITGGSFLYFCIARGFRLRIYSMLAVFLLTWVMIVIKGLSHGA